MRHLTTSRFWAAYDSLPSSVRKVADENYQILKNDPFHPSLHFKKIGRFWSIRAGIKYRALGVQEGDAIIWFWIGSHSDYDKLIS